MHPDIIRKSVSWKVRLSGCLTVCTHFFCTATSPSTTHIPESTMTSGKWDFVCPPCMVLTYFHFQRPLMMDEVIKCPYCRHDLTNDDDNEHSWEPWALICLVQRLASRRVRSRKCPTSGTFAGLIVHHRLHQQRCPLPLSLPLLPQHHHLSLRLSLHHKFLLPQLTIAASLQIEMYPSS